MRHALAPIVLAASIFACSAPEPIQTSGKLTITKVQLLQIDHAITTYRLNHGGKLPASLDVLTFRDADGLAYLDNWPEGPPCDAWGHPFVYEVDPFNRYEVISLGADGERGGQGLDADITLESARRSAN